MTFRLRFRNSQVEERKEDRSYANTSVTIPNTIISTKTSMPSVASISSINRLSEILEQSRSEDTQSRESRVKEHNPPVPCQKPVKSVLVYKTHSIDTIPSSVLVFPFDGETYKISEILLYGTFPTECEFRLCETPMDIEHPNGFSTFTIPKGTSVCRWKVEGSPTSLTALEIVGEMKVLPHIPVITDAEEDSDDEADVQDANVVDPCKIHTIEINMVSI